jgi:hypothetical protein
VHLPITSAALTSRVKLNPLVIVVEPGLEFLAASIAQLSRIGVGLQGRTIGSDIVGHKLAEDGPTCGCVTEGLGRVTGVSTIADTAGATKRVQELLVSLK